MPSLGSIHNGLLVNNSNFMTKISIRFYNKREVQAVWE